MSSGGGESPRVVAVVLNWNGRDHTLACLESLAKSDWPSMTTVVVDNGSEERIEPALPERFPEAELVRNSTNLGFAGGMNVGIRRALELEADYVLLLNNDTEVDRGMVRALVEAAEERPDAGIVSPLEFFRDSPDLVSSWGLRCDLRRGYQGPPLGRGERDRGQFQGIREIDASAGTAMLVSLPVVREVGLLDEELYLYIEDVDWSLRMREAGKRNYAVLDARLWHGVASASGGEGSPRVAYYHARNALAVSARHAPLRGPRALLRHLEILAVNLIRALKGQRPVATARAVLAGWRDYLRGRLGPRRLPVPAPPGIRLESPSCNLCGAEDFRPLRSGLPDRLLGRPGDWSIVKCAECGLVQTRPRPDRVSIARCYPQEYEQALGSGLDGEIPNRWGVLSELRDGPFRLRYGRQRAEIPGPGRRDLLEIGCASGANLARYAAAGWRVTAVEPSRELAAAATERAGIPADRVLTVAAEDAEFPEDCFDLIVMFHVIEHLHDPLSVLRATRRWIRPGGELLVGCPNYASLERRLFGRFWMGLDLPRHLYHYTPSTLTATLRRAGFDVTSVVPELEACTTSLSAGAALDALLRRRHPLPGRRALHLALTPFAVAARAAGAKPCMLVTAAPF